MSDKPTPKVRLRKRLESALGSESPREAFFGDREALRLLGIVYATDPAGYALTRDRAKDGGLGAGQLDRVAKSAARNARDGVPLQPKLIEKTGAYYRESFTASGPLIEAVADFTLQVRERLRLVSGTEVLNVEITLSNDRTLQRDLPHDAFLRKEELLKRIGTTQAAWTGNDADIQLLRAHLRKQDAPERRAVETIGRHRVEDRDYIVLPDMVLDSGGPVENPPIRLVDVRGNPIAKQLTNDRQHRVEWPNEENRRVAAEGVFKLLPQLHDAAIMGPSIAWIASLPWASPIKADPRWGGFPHLNPFGGTGVGKSSLSRVLMRVLGFPASVDLLDLPQTRFARLRAYTSTNMLPAAFDEYRRGVFQKADHERFQAELRLVYGGGREERGRADQTAVSYALIAPVMLAGEDRPGDLAVQNRTIALNPSKDDRSEEAYSEACQAPLDAFALPYWSWCLRQDDWQEQLEACRREGGEWLRAEGLLAVDSRVQNNLAILRFGWRMFLGYADHLGLEPAPLVGGTFEDTLREVTRHAMPTCSDRNSLDALLELLWVMAGNGRLRQGVHYAFRGSNLVVPLQEAVAEARRYARETEHGAVLSWDTYRGLVREALGNEDSYVLSGSERADFYVVAQEVRKQRRGILIDPLKLEKRLVLDAGQWGEALKEKTGSGGSGE